MKNIDSANLLPEELEALYQMGEVETIADGGYINWLLNEKGKADLPFLAKNERFRLWLALNGFLEDLKRLGNHKEWLIDKGFVPKEVEIPLVPIHPTPENNRYLRGVLEKNKKS